MYVCNALNYRPDIHASFRGPLVLLRLELGVLSRGKLGPVELVSEYIRHYKLEEVPVNLIEAISLILLNL